jgi:NAD(P)-dependent dehydrogenase (short-subunit alcohol dehydrogenase family)
MISSKDLFSLKGNTAIVTGGTSGIGRCTADYLASAGANVAIISRHADMAKTVAKAISEEYDVLTVGIGCDVSDPVAVDHMIDTVSRAIGTADILLRNSLLKTSKAPLSIWPLFLLLSSIYHNRKPRITLLKPQLCT